MKVEVCCTEEERLSKGVPAVVRLVDKLGLDHGEVIKALAGSSGSTVHISTPAKNAGFQDAVLEETVRDVSLTHSTVLHALAKDLTTILENASPDPNRA